jgi:uncharacterized protein YqfA (UPF0365 family)
MPQESIFIFVILAIVLLLNLLILFLFAKVVRLWLQAFLAGAKITIPTMLLMYLRRSPVETIVRLRIMAVQGGVPVPISKIESAALLGVDIERAVLALIRAREIGLDVAWEEVINKDMSDRLREDLFPEEPT